jgi:hypothetical protein
MSYPILIPLFDSDRILDEWDGPAIGIATTDDEKSFPRDEISVGVEIIPFLSRLCAELEIPPVCSKCGEGR